MKYKVKLGFMKTQTVKADQVMVCNYNTLIFYAADGSLVSWFPSYQWQSFKTVGEA